MTHQIRLYMSIFISSSIRIKMKLLIAITAIFFFNTCEAAPASGRVIKGDDVLAHRYPYLVSIQSEIFGEQHKCGGTIISPYWVVTAAHCAGVSLIVSRVVAGALNLSDTNNTVVQIRDIDLYAVIKHPEYDEIVNDIALLKMTVPFEFNEYVQPLPIAKVACYALDELNIFAGWGTEDGTGSTNALLQTGNMSIVPFQECYSKMQSVYGDNLPLNEDMHICVTGTASPCILDGGSPLVQDDRLIGLLSWLPATCLDDSLPAIFTKIGFYKDFIKKHVDDLPSA